MNEQRNRVAVLGAGTAALGAAHRLARRGFDVTVAAREPRPGGDVASENVEGFTLEAASPLVSQGDRELLAWIAELGLGDSLLPHFREIAGILGDYMDDWYDRCGRAD